ncbi:MAG: hypothetical protein WD294_01345 [Phycisphaeraceae bacterium]
MALFLFILGFGVTVITIIAVLLIGRSEAADPTHNPDQRKKW